MFFHLFPIKITPNGIGIPSVTSKPKRRSRSRLAWCGMFGQLVSETLVCLGYHLGEHHKKILTRNQDMFNHVHCLLFVSCDLPENYPESQVMSNPCIG